MNWLTRVFLILLRLAIGWHFFVEGFDKLYSHYLGPTNFSRPWTSEFYLREASGPLAEHFHALVGDPDREAVARMSLSEGAKPGTLPAGLAADWQDYRARFFDFYQLDDQQKDIAQKKMRESEERTAKWFAQGKKPIKKRYPTGTVAKEATTAERIADYRAQLQAVQEMQEVKLRLFGHDVEKEKLRSAKADLNRQRGDLMSDLNVETEALKQALRGVLTKEQLAKGELPETMFDSPIERIDLLTRYGLTAVGICLLLGLFTRLACLGGAGFLLLFYLSMPPFPWLPENLRAEGHYLFVNKNSIEMLALLVLATLPTGRWVGIDGLIHALLPWRQRRRAVDRKVART